MQIKFLFICAVAVAGLVTFSLSDKFSNSTNLMLSQIEAQAQDE